MKGIKTYIEAGYRPIPKVRLEDREYGRALQRFVGVCVDAVSIDRDARVFFLAKRRAKPMRGVWWIGGGVSAGTLLEEAMAQNFKRETSLLLDADRFRFVCTNQYLWKDREQDPRDVGCHMEGHTFAVELSSEELATAGARLDQNEYDVDFGLQAFNRDRLVIEGAHQAIVDAYDLVFPGKG